uniref:Uncharacterized protein n=1 Tax=Arundo donax TaxID=35708 RepID=A0A0A8XTB6_ARUDO
MVNKRRESDYNGIIVIFNILMVF